MKMLIKLFLSIPSIILVYLIFTYDNLLVLISPKLRGLATRVFSDKINAQFMFVKHKNKELFKIHTPNFLCRYRGDTFSSKEPETLNWIDNYGSPDSIFFDIGANIGIYSLYYATTKRGKVYSFEPSAFNLKQLAKNISINKIHDLVSIVPNPLSNVSGESRFINGNDNEGGALSAFGVDFGYDGLPINSDIKYGLMGFSLDDLIKSNLFLDAPTLIKIDVDGIEHLILEGAQYTLRLSKLKSILIEVNDDFSSQSKQVASILTGAGFKLEEKVQSYFLNGSLAFGRTHNQIWVK
jgi:FkbM family methyltransferase